MSVTALVLARYRSAEVRSAQEFAALRRELSMMIAEGELCERPQEPDAAQTGGTRCNVNPRHFTCLTLTQRF